MGLGRRQKEGKIGVGSDVAGVEVIARRVINEGFHLSCRTCGFSLRAIGMEGLGVKGEAESEGEKRDKVEEGKRKSMSYVIVIRIFLSPQAGDQNHGGLAWVGSC